jgi:hypothetical protein
MSFALYRGFVVWRNLRWRVFRFCPPAALEHRGIPVIKSALIAGAMKFIVKERVESLNVT